MQVKEGQKTGTTPMAPMRAQPSGFSIFRNSPCIWPESMSGQPGAPLRVHIVDSDAHFRGVVAQELMGDGRTVVAGQVGSLDDGRRLVRDVSFDVLLVDIALSDGAGFGLISHARSLQPGVEVVALSSSETEDDAVRAFDLGAAGFVVKSSWFISFVEAVLQVANGGAAVTPAVAHRLLRKRSSPAAAPTTILPGPVGGVVCIKLTVREHDVLRLIASGLTSNEIGGRLAISCTTVNAHVKNMYHKLHVRSRAQAVSCANAWGLL